MKAIERRCWKAGWAAALLIAVLAYTAAAYGESPPTPGAGSEALLLGRFPAVTENGRPQARVGFKDILALVLERNYGLRASQTSQGAARQALIAAQERLQPAFTSSIGYTRSVAPGFTAQEPPIAPPLTTPFSLVAQNIFTLNAGISQQDWYGTTYALNYQEQRGQANNLAILSEGGAVQSGPSSPLFDVSTTSASVTAPFAQGSGLDFNRIPVGQAQAGVTISAATTRLQEQTALNAAAVAYWSLVGQLQTVAVTEQAVRLDEQLVRDNRLRVEAGTLVPADVQASQTQLAIDQRNLLQARLKALALEDQLRVALGLDSQAFGFKPVDEPAFRPASYDPQQELQHVYANSPALATLVAALQNKRYDVLSARNAAKPTFNLSLSYSVLGYGNDFGNSPGPYGNPLGQNGNPATTGGGATLSYAKPLLDEVGPAVIAQRLNEQRALELQVQDLRTSLAIQLQTILRNIRLAEEQIAAARIAVNLAQTQLDNEVKRLSVGASRPFTVAQLQQQLSQAQQTEIAARVQFEQNDLARLVLTGEVYGQYGLHSLAGDGAP